MGILDKITDKRRERLSEARKTTPIAEVRRRAEASQPQLDFRAAISRQGGPIRLIAEVKKASPSKGLIRKDFDPSAIARIYRDRADAISVLTEEDFFQGSLKYLDEVKKASGRPVLRKDFIIDEYQLYEARAWEADAVLLIERCLSRSQARDYVSLANELGLAVLFEVHGPRELENALYSGASIIGINNRDLDTLEISLDTTFETLKNIPSGKTTVSESGIGTREDVMRIEAAGVDAMLIGTSLMQAADIAGKIDELRGGAPDGQG